MKVLLLGGTGAMGAYLSDLLSKDQGVDIVVTSRKVHISEIPNLAYLCGNARDREFIDKVLKIKFDVIVDFMNYSYDEFHACHRQLLQSTGQYIFLSSARVYANSDEPLTEFSPRLLETSIDNAFLATQRYALRKARQEDMLLSSGLDNFTIVRPYKTFSEERIQLGAYEKEQWLQRALAGKSVPLRKGMLDRRTTLTFGRDVSTVLAKLVGNSRAKGQIFQIATDESHKWSEIVLLYGKVLRELKGVDLIIDEYEHNDALESLFEGGYQVRYDVMWNRTFDSAKVSNAVGDVEYSNVSSTLEMCLRRFILDGRPFLNDDVEFANIADKMMVQI